MNYGRETKELGKDFAARLIGLQRTQSISLAKAPPPPRTSLEAGSMKTVSFEGEELEGIIEIIRKEREACVAVSFLLENLGDDLQTFVSPRHVEVISGSARILLQICLGLSTATESLEPRTSAAEE